MIAHLQATNTSRSAYFFPDHFKDLEAAKLNSRYFAWFYACRENPTLPFAPASFYLNDTNFKAHQFEALRAVLRHCEAIAQDWHNNDTLAPNCWSRGRVWTTIKPGEILQVGDWVFASGQSYQIDRVAPATAFSGDSKWERTVGEWRQWKRRGTATGYSVAARATEVEVEAMPDPYEIKP